MRRLVVVVLAFSAMAAGCSVNAGDMAAGTTDGAENRITFDELTDAMLDPESDLDFTEVDGIDLEAFAPTSQSFCEAFAAVQPNWVDDSVVAVQLYVDAWEPVDDTPPEVADDVAALIDHGERLLAWHFGRIDREDRPVSDLTLFERLERVADVAVATCEALPLRVGHDDRWALDRDWEPAELERRCAQSRLDAEEGLPLYRELRGREPGHLIQIELASLVEWYRSFDSVDHGPPLWFVPELHGLGPAGEIVALAPCDDA